VHAQEVRHALQTLPQTVANLAVAERHEKPGVTAPRRAIYSTSKKFHTATQLSCETVTNCFSSGLHAMRTTAFE